MQHRQELLFSSGWQLGCELMQRRTHLIGKVLQPGDHLSAASLVWHWAVAIRTFSSHAR